MLYLAVWEYQKKHEAKDNWMWLLLPGNDLNIANSAIAVRKCKHKGYIHAGVWIGGITEFKGGFTPCFALGDLPILFGTEKYKLYLISSEKIGWSPVAINYEKNQIS